MSEPVATKNENRKERVSLTILQFFVGILPRLQRGMLLIASQRKLRIWLISTRVSEAAHHLTHVRGRNPRGRPAHALQQNLFDLRGFVPGMGEEFGIAGEYRMKAKEEGRTGYRGFKKNR
jgi:hypothetical protein